VISLHVLVVTTFRRHVVNELSGKLVTFEETQMPQPLSNTKDPIKSLYEPDGASVTVGLEEKISGPANTYSSVAVRIEISSRCKQDEIAIRNLTKALHGEAMRALHHYVAPTLELLLSHLPGNDA
jgi:hypothetical protein